MRARASNGYVKRSPIKLAPFVRVDFPIDDEDMRKADEERAARNHIAWAAAVPPTGPDDVRAGDVIVLAEEQWQRGPGVVDSVDSQGNVWATFGQREHPHPEDRKTVRCFSVVRYPNRGASTFMTKPHEETWTLEVHGEQEFSDRNLGAHVITPGGDGLFARNRARTTLPALVSLRRRLRFP